MLLLPVEECRRAGGGGERSAGRAVRGGEGKHGEALAVLLVQGQQALKLLLNVVHLPEKIGIEKNIDTSELYS